MELKFFMIDKCFLFIFILTLVSCDNNRVKLSENNFEEEPVKEEIKFSPTEYYYGITLDSFSYLTKKKEIINDIPRDIENFIPAVSKGEWNPKK